MTEPKRRNTLLKGHTLKAEGASRYDEHGHSLPGWRRDGHAACSCGAVSEKGVSTYRGRKWHAEHKDAVRAAEADAKAKGMETIKRIMG